MGSDFDFGSSSRNQSSFHLLLEEIGFAAYYTKIAIPIVFCDTYESFTTSSITEILHAQLLTELKRIFEEISNMLDLLEIFFKCPSEKTAEPLKLLSEYRKCDSIELSTSDERGKLPDALRTLMNRIFQKTDNEYLVENSNSSSEEYNVQFMKQPLSISRSISQESSKLNLEKEKKLIPLQICEPLVNSGVEILCKSSRCRDQKTRLQKQLKLWQIKYEVILLEFGEISVEKSAEERKRKEYALFQQIYRGHFQNRHGNGHGRRSSCEIGCLNGFLKSQIENENCDCVKVNTAVSGEKPVRGAEALLTQGNHQSSIKEMFARNKDERRKEEQHNSGVSTYQNNSDATNPEMRGRSCITAEERSSGGEGNNGSGNVNGTIVMTSASEEGNLSFSVQQDYSNEREFISLDVVPPPSVATILYTNYKLLLVSQSQVLLSCDVLKLKDWAAQNFSIENAQNATEVFLQLDKKGVINASDLSPLRNFFESIIRYDLVYIIDEFLLGDYTLLHKISVMKKRDSTKALQNPQRASRYTSLLTPLRQTHRRGPARNEAFSGSLQLNTDQNQAGSRKPENSNGAQSSSPHQRNQPLFPNTSALSNTNSPKLPSVIPNRESHSSTQQQTLKSFASGFTQRSVFVDDGPVASDRRTTAGNSSTRRHSSVTSNARNTQAFGNDSSKLSKLQPPEESIGSNWLCSHYKRQCYVKFECCEKFWPCHRCHNNQSTCGQKKLKSRDTQMVKCVHCNKVQPFGQFCCNCATIFASYFCGMCKHLTGNDDHPYHCNKCGICRIHGDRSFHCDVCGVCLDVQLRGNHKCRAGSAHDECCICLEDAFTGCQILPCSHKVHKECATQMIRSGITRCPICRESFAHKLERRPLQNARKRSGK